MNGEVVPIQEQRLDIDVSYTPQEMALRLSDMKSKLELMQSFFKEVMVKNQDYGVIQGTDKPSLLKPGAEKLCELYGYAITVKELKETVDHETGYYRAIVTVALVNRRTGAVVAEGVGEANTNEGRYRWRWVPEWKLPKNLDRKGLYSEERRDKNGKVYTLYKVPNEDPWALWNTVLKMAKKRALIDATLSATRSSGIFTQDVEDLEEWIEAAPETAEATQSPQREAPKTPQPKQAKAKQPDSQAFVFAKIREWAEGVGISVEEAQEAAKGILRNSYKVESCSQLTPAQWSAVGKNVDKLISNLEKHFIKEAEELAEAAGA